MGNVILRMKTASEIRRARLNQLVSTHGSMADLCQALGYARNDAAKLTRIANGNIRHERGGKPYQMGDEMARAIEETLNLERGWMDTPEDYELAASDNGRRILSLFDKIPESDRATAMRLLDALTKPSVDPQAPNGTHG